MADNQVFLSYCLEDIDAARHLVRAIEARGWPISWERYPDPDAIASLALHEAASVADCIVVLWSENAVRSPEVLDEARRGRERGILVQASLDGAQIPMPFVLDDLPRLTDDASMARLVARVAEVLASRPGGGVRPPPFDAAMLELAEVQADAGDLDAAIAAYEKWVAGTPGDMEAARRLGDLYLAADRPSAAAHVYARVAEHYAKTRFLVLAIETYRRVTALAPDIGAYRDRLNALLVEKEHLTSGSRQAMSAVQFTVTAPAYVHGGESFTLDVWAHRDEDREKVARRLVDWSAPPTRPTGAEPALSTRLHIDGFEIPDADKSLRWSRGLGVVSFDVDTPDATAPGGRSGVVGIYFLGLQIARIHFVVQVADVTSPPEVIPTRQERHARAVAVFAPEDRAEVEERIRSFEKAAPGIDVHLDPPRSPAEFLDTLSTRDVLYLFWSPRAAGSRDVERCWRYALRLRGIDFIDPVPLRAAAEAEPPEELRLHRGNVWVFSEPGEAPSAPPADDRGPGGGGGPERDPS